MPRRTSVLLTRVTYEDMDVWTQKRRLPNVSCVALCWDAEMLRLTLSQQSLVYALNDVLRLCACNREYRLAPKTADGHNETIAPGGGTEK